MFLNVHLRSIGANLEIESMLIHPTKCGYRNNKNNKNRKIENNGNNGKRTQGKNDWNGDSAINAGNIGGNVRYGFRGCNAGDAMIVCAGSVIAVIWINN